MSHKLVAIAVQLNFVTRPGGEGVGALLGIRGGGVPVKSPRRLRSTPDESFVNKEVLLNE